MFINVHNPVPPSYISFKSNIVFQTVIKKRFEERGCSEKSFKFPF